MADCIEIIEQLLHENSLVDTTEAQKECNLHRIAWLNVFSREKPTHEPVKEENLLIERITNGDLKQHSPAYMLIKD